MKTVDSPHVEVGDLVYLYSDRNKSCERNRYLVTSSEGTWCNIRKFIGSQLRKTSYRVKMSECYKIPDVTKLSHHAPQHDYSDDESSTPTHHSAPPDLPEVPQEIATPAVPYVPPDAHPQPDPVFTTTTTTDESPATNATDI
jgi:hypothetical protein